MTRRTTLKRTKNVRHGRVTGSAATARVVTGKGSKRTGTAHRTSHAKKPTVSKLKKQAWKLMSEYIRLRDCLKTTGTLTRGACYTCNKHFDFKELQAGHLLDGRCGEMFLDERGMMSQCSGCNVFLHGNKEVYIPKFIKENGQELYDELMREKRTPKHWTVGELLTEIESIKKSTEYIKSL